MLIASMTYEEMYREIRNDFRDLYATIMEGLAKFQQSAKRAKHYPFGIIYEWKHPKSQNTYTYFFQVKRHSEWDKEPRLVIYAEFDDEGGKTTITIVNANSGILQIGIFRPHFFKRYYERNLTTIQGNIPQSDELRH